LETWAKKAAEGEDYSVRFRKITPIDPANSRETLHEPTGFGPRSVFLSQGPIALDQRIATYGRFYTETVDSWAF